MMVQTSLSRRSLGGMLAALLPLTVVGPAMAQQPVKLNEVLRSLFYTPQYVALRMGAFEQEGIKIDGPKTTWGMQAALTEVVSGSSNIALLGPEAAALTQDAGPERRFINFARLTNGDGSFIVSKTPMAKFTIADLKGKTIVTAGKGATPSLVLERLLKRAGLDPVKDLTIRYIPQSGNILPSFLEANTHFAQAFEPGVVMTVNQGRGHRVASVHELAGPMPYTAYVASVAYIERNPKIIQGFTNAIYKGLLHTEKSSPAEIAKLIAPDFKDVPEDTIAAVVAEYKKIKIWATDPVLDEPGMAIMTDMLLEAGVIKAKVPYDRVVNPTFARQAVQSIKK
jgi:NitT/TauT family transport system substrate-binding protein